MDRYIEDQLLLPTNDPLLAICVRQHICMRHAIVLSIPGHHVSTAHPLATVPAGYLELRESTAAGAAREAMEEANCPVQVIAPYVHFDIVSIGQAYILFRAAATDPDAASAGDETTDIQWVSPRSIPFEDLAFSSVAVALQLYVEDLEAGRFRVHHGQIVKQPGAGPNQPGTFTLTQHISMCTTEVHVSSP